MNAPRVVRPPYRPARLDDLEVALGLVFLFLGLVVLTVGAWTQ